MARQSSLSLEHFEPNLHCSQRVSFSGVPSSLLDGLVVNEETIHRLQVALPVGVSINLLRSHLRANPWHGLEQVQAMYPMALVPENHLIEPSIVADYRLATIKGSQ